LKLSQQHPAVIKGDRVMITINEKDFNPLQRLMNKLHPDVEVFVFNEDKPG
jgi:hypothetical protein